MRALILVLTIACNSYVAPPPARFVAASTYTAPIRVTERAVTVRGVDGVLAAGGRYLGIVISEGRGVNPSVTVVRNATWQAAHAGGTHIVLRKAQVDHVTKPTAMVGPSMVGYVQVREDDVHAVFDVFRVAPTHWDKLHPQMRPIPVR